MSAFAICGLGIAAIAAITAAFWRALSAEKRAGQAETRAGIQDVNNAGLAAQLADSTKRERIEKERADGLDDLIAEMSVRRDVDGAFDELLLKWARSSANRGDGAGIVYPPASPSGPGPDDLLPLE